MDMAAALAIAGVASGDITVKDPDSRRTTSPLITEGPGIWDSSQVQMVRHVTV